MTVLAQDLYNRTDYLVRNNPRLAGTIKDIAKAAPPTSKGTEWVKESEINSGPPPIAFIQVGMANILTYRFLDKFIAKLVFVGERGETQSAPEAVLCPSEEFEGFADIDFFSPGNEIPEYDRNSAARGIMEMLGKSHGRIYKFLSMPEWTLNARGIDKFLPSDTAHDQLKLALDLPYLPGDEKIASFVDFRNHPDERFARAWQFAQTNNTPIKKDELAEHVGLNVENKAFAILWDRLSLAGANIQYRGRPRKKIKRVPD